MRSTKLPSWIESLLGLGPVAPPPHAFRVDARSVGYAGFERRDGGAGLALVRSDGVPLDPETFQEGLLGGPARELAGLQGRIAELLSRLEGGVGEASLVLPDAWLRLAFTDVAELPSGAQAREDVLRWKLKRLVPFRVEELRLSSVEVEPLPDQSPEEPYRHLLGFGVDALLTQLEEVFAANGVRIGAITNDSLAIVTALAAGRADADADDLHALALVGDDGYSLVFSRHGQPVLHRHKGFAGSLPAGARGDLVRRDLRLTLTFLDESFPGAAISRVVLATPRDSTRAAASMAAEAAPGDIGGTGDAGDAAWLDWLSESLGCPAQRLHRDDLPVAEAAGRDIDWQRLAPLVGAVSREVAA